MPNTLKDKLASNAVNVAPKRRRLIFTVCLLIAVLAAALIAGSVFMHRFIYTNNRFLALTNIEIFPDDAATRQRILQELKLCKINLKSLDDPPTLGNISLSAIRERIMADYPQYKTVEIRRIFPSTLSIRISNRQPVAIISYRKGKQTLQLKIDNDGIFLPMTHPHLGALPRVSGFSYSEEPSIGKNVTSQSSIHTFLEFIKIRDLRPDGNEFDIAFCLIDEEHHQLTMTMNASRYFAQGARMVLPFEDIEDKLNKLANIMEIRTSDQKPPVQFIDMTFNNVPVR